MAAKKIKPARGKGKLRGKMPSKRSINLVLVNENKINPLTALLGILLVLVLAAAFSKFLVMDRLTAVSRAQARATQVQRDLDDALDALDNIGDVSETYAHYTLEGMTAAELSLVDRSQVLALMDSILPKVEEGPSEEDLEDILSSLFRSAPQTGNDALDKARQQSRMETLEQLIPVPEYTINKWSLTDNLLTVEVTGQTLERLNLLGQQMEQSSIVDSCTIVTANKDARKLQQDGVWARYIVYLQKPGEGEEGAVTAAPLDESGKSILSDFGKVTQFVGGEASQE